MSYAPIYNKLQELDTRLSTLENAPKPEVVTPVNVAAPVTAPDTTADVFDELKTNYINLLNECNPLSNRIAILS